MAQVSRLTRTEATMKKPTKATKRNRRRSRAKDLTTRPATGIKGARSAGGVNVGMCDGSVRFLNTSLSA
jgi:prepilin-type processing-associated H-X9-DG protein